MFSSPASNFETNFLFVVETVPNRIFPNGDEVSLNLVNALNSANVVIH